MFLAWILLRFRKTELDMVYWRGIPLEQLDRQQIQGIADAVIAEVVNLRELKSRRDRQDSHIIIFILGVVFTITAILVGFAMH
jgi:hypothetical protein